MRTLLRALHPTFDALSAHADRSDVEGAHTRVGRHVDGCATCRATVAEIHALGDEARELASESAPPGLWARIEAVAKEAPLPSAATSSRFGERGEVDEHARAVPGRPAARTDAMPPLRRRAVAALTVAALAAAVVAAIAWPRVDVLQAASTSRLTFSPTRPVPGERVTVRYRPSPELQDAERLVLVARFAKPAGRNPLWFGGRVQEELADSIAVLTRGAGGDFTTTIRLPTDFLAAELALVDPAHDRRDPRAQLPWSIVGGTSDGAPSLPAFLAALDLSQRAVDVVDTGERRRSGDPSDSLIHYFPRHPAGWAYSRTYGVAKGRFDLLRFFESAERKYASMFDALWPADHLDAERLHDMVVFANRIDEPGEALRWAERFARERPDDPRALLDLANALHQLELRQPPALGDSIRRRLPLLDASYRAAPVPSLGFPEAAGIVGSYGDSATRALWEGRVATNSAAGNIWMMSRWRRGTTDAALEAELSARVSPGCAKPAGRYPVDRSIADWRMLCERYRGMAFAALSTLGIEGGRLAAASGAVDSALAAMTRGQVCTPSLPYLNRGRIALQRADTLAAMDAFARASSSYPDGDDRVLDSVRPRLGARFDAVSYASRVDSLRRDAMACWIRERARRSAQGRD